MTKLYFKLDNHWNERAGYFVTELLIDKLRTVFPDRDIPNIPKINWEVDEEYKKGFHQNVMGIDDLNERNKTASIPSSQMEEVQKYGVNRYVQKILKKYCVYFLFVIHLVRQFAHSLKKYLNKVYSFLMLGSTKSMKK